MCVTMIKTHRYNEVSAQGPESSHGSPESSHPCAMKMKWRNCFKTKAHGGAVSMSVYFKVSKLTPQKTDESAGMLVSRFETCAKKTLPRFICSLRRVRRRSRIDNSGVGTRRIRRSVIHNCIRKHCTCPPSSTSVAVTGSRLNC